MPVPEEARRVYERFKPFADRDDAARADWLRTHMLPGESVGSALRRRAALNAPRRRAQLAQSLESIAFRRSYSALMAGRYDDHRHDDEWFEANPQRAYRIRSVRPTDGCWWLPAPAVLVVRTATQEAQFVPAAGWPIPPHDADGWGEMIFAARDGFNARNRAK